MKKSAAYTWTFTVPRLQCKYDYNVRAQERITQKNNNRSYVSEGEKTAKTMRTVLRAVAV